jgi:hypothetical protein
VGSSTSHNTTSTACYGDSFTILTAIQNANFYVVKVWLIKAKAIAWISDIFEPDICRVGLLRPITYAVRKFPLLPYFTLRLITDGLQRFI